MKQSELEKCAGCGKGMAHAGDLHFYRVKIEQFVLNPAAIQRQHGLEVMMGGNAALASVLGPDEDMAQGMGESSMLVCATCIMHPAAVLWEASADG